MISSFCVQSQWERYNERQKKLGVTLTKIQSTKINHIFGHRLASVVVIHVVSYPY